jgi:hypothetical protein
VPPNKRKMTLTCTISTSPDRTLCNNGATHERRDDIGNLNGRAHGAYRQAETDRHDELEEVDAQVDEEMASRQPQTDPPVSAHL